MNANIKKVCVNDQFVHFQTADGQHFLETIAHYPTLRNATATDRQLFVCSNLNIHWTNLNEDFTYEGFVKNNVN
jgi:hypothetical protein